MLSLIIPTMWKCESFLSILKQLVDRPSIGEIIIINNDKNKTPNDEILKNHKIKIYESETNLYVNPSWNLGAKLASFDKLSFLSDDVDIDTNVFDKTSQFMETTANVGMIGILTEYSNCPLHKDIYKKFYVDGSINFVNSKEPDSSKRPPPTGIGNLFFMFKDDWKPIPEEIKIFHGEVLQWSRLERVKDNYIITNCTVDTPWHVTWKELADNPETASEFVRIQLSDQRIAESIGFTFN